MRNRTVVLVLTFLILCLAPLQTFASETSQATNSEIVPMWTDIVKFSNTFDISGSGLFEFDTSLTAYSNINKVVINANLQQYVNGNWQTIKSWTSTSYSNMGDLTQSWYVMSGYYYRLVSSGAAYQNNILMEQTYYTGPSYWY